jgi:hypothetical protein
LSFDIMDDINIMPNDSLSQLSAMASGQEIDESTSAHGTAQTPGSKVFRLFASGSRTHWHGHTRARRENVRERAEHKLRQSPDFSSEPNKSCWRLREPSRPRSSLEKPEFLLGSPLAAREPYLTARKSTIRCIYAPTASGTRYLTRSPFC